MAVVLKELYKHYTYYVYEARDKRLEHYFLMGTPLKAIALTAFYWYFVRKLGPKLMEKREPFQLKTVMMVYNVLQVIVNLILGVLGLHMILFLETNFKCSMADYSNTPEATYKAKLTYFYYAIKISDLLDTVFIILRKKNNQASFLHVYHHGFMVLAGYVFANYMPAGHASMLGVANCCVHSVMYFYYFLTCIYPDLKTSIGWKRHITHMQMIQFLFLTIHFTHPLFNSNCKYPKTWLALPALQNVFLFILFADFYYKAYCKKVKVNDEKQKSVKSKRN